MRYLYLVINAIGVALLGLPIKPSIGLSLILLVFVILLEDIDAYRLRKSYKLGYTDAIRHAREAIQQVKNEAQDRPLGP